MLLGAALVACALPEYRTGRGQREGGGTSALGGVATGGDHPDGSSTIGGTVALGGQAGQPGGASGGAVAIGGTAATGGSLAGTSSGGAFAGGTSGGTNPQGGALAGGGEAGNGGQAGLAASGGVVIGGAGASGTTAGGAGGGTAAGGVDTGGTATGATISGGTATGGTGTGGVSMGGAPAGGVPTSGTATGGAPSGGVATGGVGTGGGATGGSSSTGGTLATCDPNLPSTGTYYIAAPNGTGTMCVPTSPCSASTAIGKLAPGQTAYLKGGTYSGLTVSNSGSPGNYIKIVAYPCELPIVDSGGVSLTGTYISIQGIVSRNAVTGFANDWIDGNGHVEFINCIADMHSRGGIAFYSGTGVHVKQCIVAHTGYSTTSSWSSGVELYGAQGTYQDNIVEQTVSFENIDNEQHTDGSGFIADVNGTGATFVNNIGFRNGGSCIRVTTSNGTHIINNSCYHNGMDPAAQSPANPDEIFFSSSATTGSVLYNNIAVATGTVGDTQAMSGSAAATSANNLTNNTNTISFWVDADVTSVTNPDFRLSPAATNNIVGKGTTAEAPSEDIGFDPRCITKVAPTGTGVQSWWIYSIDYAYIEKIGGVAQCFHPKARSGPPDIGAYAF
jgi:hypothetical protein